MKYQNPEECLRAIEDLPMDQPATVQTILQDMLSKQLSSLFSTSGKFSQSGQRLTLQQARLC